MTLFSRPLSALAAGWVLTLSVSAFAQLDQSSDPAPAKTAPASAKAVRAEAKDQTPVPDVSLYDAVKKGLVTVSAESLGDGRMMLSVKNKTKKKLNVILPPGIVAQSATGQFGGMGGGGGGGGMGGGGMGGGGGGMGGGGMGGGGMGGGMGGGGGRSQTMPPMMGMMMLARMIMYFCGDPSSWDQRSLMIGMMGGGGMGGMGGGGMGGMGGGGMGGAMGGGMRSVPPTDLPYAALNPSQTRSLATRLVGLSQPDPEAGIVFPEQGEKLRLADISDINDKPLVQKALRRLAASKAPSAVAQLVMWRIAAGLDWNVIDQMSQKWANANELVLAREFVARLEKSSEGETGRLLFEFEGSDDAGRAAATELSKLLDKKTILGLVGQVGIPERPEGPTVACTVKLSATDAQVQVKSSDTAAQNWMPFGKFSLAVKSESGSFDAAGFSDSLAEGILNRLVRARLGKGSKESGKLLYPVMIDNASPLVLEGLAMVGTASKADATPNVLLSIGAAPRRTTVVATTDEVVRSLGLKKGIKVVAVDLSGL